MCGVFFLTYPKGDAPHEDLIRDTVGEMRRRGPDNLSIEIGKQRTLGHVRLAIIDTSDAADQPMRDTGGRWEIVYNGEIYNYPEIKAELEEQGHPVPRNSDTQVLLEAIEHWGLERTLTRVRGMFAFVLRNRENGRWWAVRDHFGQKPLYYAFLPHGGIAIASDMRVLLKVDGVSPSPRPETYATYLGTLGILAPDQTFFDDISMVPAGHWLEGGEAPTRPQLREYYHIAELFDPDLNLELSGQTDDELIEQLDRLMEQAVSRHLVADVPIGVLLSGGIDSSLVFFYAQQQMRNLICFTKVSPGIEQIPGAVIPQLLSKHPATTLSNLERPENYVQGLWDFVGHSQAPSRWGGGPPMTNLCEHARALGIRVLLGGDCVDEYFAGYLTYEAQFEENNRGPLGHGALLSYRPPAGLSDHPTAGRAFSAAITESRNRINKTVAKSYFPEERPQQADLLMDTGNFLQVCNLPHSDAYSMARSVELRNPMLDMDLVRFVVNLPVRAKWRSDPNSEIGHKNKYLLRRLAGDRVGNFINVPKEGTRNYSVEVSNPKYWNLTRFEVLHSLGLSPDDVAEFPPKVFFKVINLEFFHRRFVNQNNRFPTEVLSRAGQARFRAIEPEILSDD